MWIQVSGQDYPSADGLNSADVAELMAYTETVDGMSVGVTLEKYASYKFYTMFDYTGHRDLFILPQIQVDAGEKVQSRFVQLICNYVAAPQSNADLEWFVYHYEKQLIQFMPSLALEIIR